MKLTDVKKNSAVLVAMKAEDIKTRVARAKAKILSAKSVERVEKRYQATNLRTRGYSMSAIAELLDMSEASVRDLLAEAINYAIKHTVETQEEGRYLQDQRLDMLLRQFLPSAAPGEGQAGNLGAAQMVLNIEQRRSKLLNLDVPEAQQQGETSVRIIVGVDVDAVI